MEKKEIIFWVAAVLVIALIVFLIAKNLPFTQTGEVVSEEKEDKVLATVNGIEVKESDVQKAKEYIEAASGKVADKSAALERAISEKLLLEEAEKQGYSMTTEETELEITRILATKNQTLKDLRKKVEARNGNYDSEIESYRQQFLIEKFLENTIPSEQITDEEALVYYNENKDTMFTGGVVVPYEQISEPLKKSIVKKKGTDFLNNYLRQLHENAEIVYIN